jgi:hypothetical protein
MHNRNRDVAPHVHRAAVIVDAASGMNQVAQGQITLLPRAPFGKFQSAVAQLENLETT